MFKILVVFAANLLAFSSLLSTIFSVVGVDSFFKIIVPALILFATNTGTSLAIISLLDDQRKKKRQCG